MFKQSLQSQDLIFANEGSFIHESIGFSDFMYRMSLLESTVLDTANRNANYSNEHKLGILSEAAIGETIKKGGDAIVNAVKALTTLIANFMTTVYNTIMQSSVAMAIWMKANKNNLMHVKIPQGFKFKHNVNSFNSSKLNSASKLESVVPEGDIGPLETFKEKVMSKLGLKPKTDDPGSVFNDVKVEILGEETENISQSDVNGAIDVVERGQGFIKQFQGIFHSIKGIGDRALSSAKSSGADARNALASISACKWIIQIVKNAMSACNNGISQSFNLCKRLIPKSGLPAVQAGSTVKDGDQ